MDLSSTIIPNSEQVNAEDLIAGPVTVTITSIEKGTADQPVFIHLAEFPGRTFRPGKTVRRLIVACWGPETATFIGRRMTLFRDPDVKWAGQATGGVRISHLSHLDKPVTIMLATTRGKRSQFIVEPLETDPDRDWLAELKLAGDDLEAVTALGKAAGEAHAPSDAIEALRVKFRALTKTPTGRSVVTGEVPDDSSGTASLPVDPAHLDYVAKVDER